jgi:hypothetical protein
MKLRVKAYGKLSPTVATPANTPDRPPFSTITTIKMADMVEHREHKEEIKNPQTFISVLQEQDSILTFYTKSYIKLKMSPRMP